VWMVTGGSSISRGRSWRSWSRCASSPCTRSRMQPRRWACHQPPQNVTGASRAHGCWMPWARAEAHMDIEAEQRLFEDCLAAPEESERLLDAHQDAALARRVRRLLQLHDAHPAQLASPAFASGPPRRAGCVEVLERLGEGGIGEVWLAEQLQPVHRRVALKIIKFGVGTQEVLTRFGLERQTLAMLTHPTVARFHDASTTTDGRPWFAMEYVPGLPITRYCDEHRLTLEGRLALFAEVCAGVQHAHLRGVIHRDLKPSNILVTQVDGRALPKIIDCGIAKATTATSLDTGGPTHVGRLLGTPEAKSPEQAPRSTVE